MESEEAEFVVCLAPDHIDKLDYVRSTQTSITLSWTKPDYTGGCPIWSYRFWMDDGSGTYVEQDRDLI